MYLRKEGGKTEPDAYSVYFFYLGMVHSLWARVNK